ncbi:MAG: hypothetical protein ACI4TB_03010, partial [Lachnospiraceae bacterium]
MSEGNACYLSFHAEEVLRTMVEEKSVAEKESLSARQVTERPFCELLREELRGELLFLDFDHVEAMTDEATVLFEKCISSFWGRNRICLFHMTAFVKEQVRTILEKLGILCALLPGSDGSFWGEVPGGDTISEELPEGSTDGREPGSGKGLTEEAVLNRVNEIKEGNLFILMEDGIKGKYFDIVRILKDGELCMYYFFYCLAMKLVYAGMVSGRSAENNNICFVPDNEQSVVIAKELAGLLGADAITEFPSAGLLQEKKQYIVVRDVIHMSCELDGLTAAATGCGAQIKGAVSLLDIQTGIGSIKNRVSLYTI